MTINLLAPTAPAAPPADIADWQTWDVYLRRIAAINWAASESARIAAAEKHAQAQADTAVALANSVVAQQGLTAAFNAAPPVVMPTEAQLAAALLASPLCVGMSPTPALAAARAAAQAYRAAYPSVVKPPVPFPTV